jgi:ankyrin repeat protein
VVYNGSLEVVTAILEKLDGTVIDNLNDAGHNVLHRACDEGYVNIAKRLLEFGACPTSVHKITKATALHMASQQGHSEVVGLLLSWNLDQDAKDVGGWTALHMAAHEGHLDVVNQLVTSGAALDVVDNDGWTALHKAARRGKDDIVTTLIQRGADRRIRTPDKGCTALHHACVSDENNHSAAIITTLLNGIEDEDQDDRYVDMQTWDMFQTPIQIVVSKGRRIFCERILACRPDLEKKDNDGFTALHFAANLADTENAQLVKLLLEHGANLAALNNEGRTPEEDAKEKGLWNAYEILKGNNLTILICI